MCKTRPADAGQGSCRRHSRVSRNRAGLRCGSQPGAMQSFISPGPESKVRAGLGCGCFAGQQVSKLLPACHTSATEIDATPFQRRLVSSSSGGGSSSGPGRQIKLRRLAVRTVPYRGLGLALGQAHWARMARHGASRTAWQRGAKKLDSIINDRCRLSQSAAGQPSRCICPGTGKPRESVAPLSLLRAPHGTFCPLQVKFHRLTGEYAINTTAPLEPKVRVKRA